MGKSGDYDIIKEVLRNSWKTLAYITVLLIWVKLYHPHFLLIVAVLNGGSIVSWFFADEKGFKDLFASLFWLNVILAFYYFVSKQLGVFGAVFSFVVMVVIVVTFILVRRWSVYLETLRTVERMIWGESLDRKRKTRRKNKK